MRVYTVTIPNNSVYTHFLNFPTVNNFVLFYYVLCVCVNFTVNGLISTWKIFVQPEDLTQVAGTKCLSSPSATKQLYGLDIVRQLYISPAHEERVINEECSATPCKETMKLMETLLCAETERVRIAAAILLCCFDEEGEYDEDKDKVWLMINFCCFFFSHYSFPVFIISYKPRKIFILKNKAENFLAMFFYLTLHLAHNNF